MSEGDQRSLRVGGDRMTIRFGADESGGQLLAAEATMAPGGGLPLLHRHPAHEVYRVHRGRVTFYLEGASGDVERREAQAGETVAIAGGRAHTVRNESDATAEAFVVFAPGAQMEALLRAVSAQMAAGGSSPQQLLAVAESHGVETVGPVPSRP